jgi:hypothetical protein
MTRIFSITALLAVSLVAVNESSAKGPSGNTSHKSIQQYSSSHRSSRTYDSHYRNWRSYCWNSEYNCYFYYCPTECCNYYWYAPARCYYPVSYLRVYRPSVCAYQTPAPGVTPLPVQVNVPITVTNTNQNVLANGSPVPVPPGLAPNVP